MPIAAQLSSICREEDYSSTVQSISAAQHRASRWSLLGACRLDVLLVIHRLITFMPNAFHGTDERVVNMWAGDGEWVGQWWYSDESKRTASVADGTAALFLSLLPAAAAAGAAAADCCCCCCCCC